jgi:hypothetical protein
MLEKLAASSFLLVDYLRYNKKSYYGALILWICKIAFTSKVLTAIKGTQGTSIPELGAASNMMYVSLDRNPLSNGVELSWPSSKA